MNLKVRSLLDSDPFDDTNWIAKIPRPLMVLVFTVLVCSCGVMEKLNQTPYDRTQLVYDEVTQKSRVVFVDGLLGKILCNGDGENVGYWEQHFSLKQCYAREYVVSIEDPEIVRLHVLVASSDWLFIDKAMAEGKILEISKPVRSVAGGSIFESFYVYIPIGKFAEWSCRPERVILRVSGDFYSDIRLDTPIMRQYLAKVQDLGIDIPEHSCTARVSGSA